MAILEPIVPGSPGSGVGGVGGGIMGNIPGGLPGAPIVVGTAIVPRITYGGHIIDLPRFSAWRWQAEPNPLHTFDLAEDGNSRTTLYSRMDIPVAGSFRVIENNPNLRMDLLNFWQWAIRGYGWFITLDATHIVDTTLVANSSGATVTVSDPAGIEVGRAYKLIYAYGYALVEVQSISGNVIILTATPDVTFPAGTRFRDQFFYRCVIKDQDAPCPIIDMDAGSQSLPQGWFSMELAFDEDAIS